MKAYGMHLRCRGVEEHMAVSDSDVAASFNRVHRMSPTDPMPVVRKEEYLWWIKEILELNYKEYYVVVLAYKWVKVRSTSPNPTIVRDIYGFTFANISDRTMVGLGPKCFAFPIHVQQVFYSKDSLGPEWRTTVGQRTGTKTEVRGRQEDRHYTLEEEGGLFAVGHNAQFAGLALDIVVDMAQMQPDEEGEVVVIPDVSPTLCNVERHSEDVLLGDSSEDEMYM
jgi:hypothetical protein